MRGSYLGVWETRDREETSGARSVRANEEVRPEPAEAPAEGRPGRERLREARPPALSRLEYSVAARPGSDRREGLTRELAKVSGREADDARGARAGDDPISADG